MPMSNQFIKLFLRQFIKFLFLDWFFPKKKKNFHFFFKLSNLYQPQIQQCMEMNNFMGKINDKKKTKKNLTYNFSTVWIASLTSCQLLRGNLKCNCILGQVKNKKFVAQHFFLSLLRICEILLVGESNRLLCHV